MTQIAKTWVPLAPPMVQGEPGVPDCPPDLIRQMIAHHRKIAEDNEKIVARYRNDPDADLPTFSREVLIKSHVSIAHRHRIIAYALEQLQ